MRRGSGSPYAAVPVVMRRGSGSEGVEVRRGSGSEGVTHRLMHRLSTGAAVPVAGQRKGPAGVGRAFTLSIYVHAFSFIRAVARQPHGGQVDIQPLAFPCGWIRTRGSMATCRPCGCRATARMNEN